MSPVCVDRSCLLCAPCAGPAVHAHRTPRTGFPRDVGSNDLPALSRAHCSFNTSPIRHVFNGRRCWASTLHCFTAMLLLCEPSFHAGAAARILVGAGSIFFAMCAPAVPYPCGRLARRCRGTDKQG